MAGIKQVEQGWDDSVYTLPGLHITAYIHTVPESSAMDR